MLIATYFKRPDAPVDLPNLDGSIKRYFFRPVDPRSPESEHVANVTDKDHIARLLAIREGYYVADANDVVAAAEAGVGAAGRPVAAAPPAEPAKVDTKPEDTTKADTVATTDAPGPDPHAEQAATEPKDEGKAAPASDVSAAAEALLALPLAKCKAEIKTAPRPVLEAALEIESAKGSDERATITKALKAALA